jgi:hypothetical protein
MKIYKTQSEVEKDIKDGILEIIEKEKVETIEIGGIKYSKQEVEEKLKDIKAVE